MALESIHVSGPEPAEWSQPGIDLLKWLGSQPVKTALCVDGGFDESGLAQHPQVLRHRRLGHTKTTLDLPNRLLGRDQEPQYRPAIRLGDDCKYRSHPPNIRGLAYARQGIYREPARRRFACGTRAVASTINDTVDAYLPATRPSRLFCSRTFAAYLGARISRCRRTDISCSSTQFLRIAHGKTHTTPLAHFSVALHLQRQCGSFYQT